MQQEGLRHLHARRRGKSFSESPHPHATSWVREIDRFMYVVAILAPMSYAPQVYKLYTEQNPEGLSIAAFILLFIVNALWLVYAWAHRSTPLLVTSILFCGFHVVIVTGILLYR